MACPYDQSAAEAVGGGGVLGFWIELNWR